MPRKALIETTEFPYHITNRANRKEYFDVPLDILWPIFVRNLNYIVREMDIKLYSFVLMDNHYHALLSTPKLGLSEAMGYFQREVAKQSNKLSKKINHLFGGKYKWCLIQNENYFWNATKYIYRNPIEAGLCNKVEEYKFSSLNVNNEQTPWSFTDHFNAPDHKVNFDLNWLNEKFSSENNEAIKAALRRCEFKPPKDKKGKRPQLPMTRGQKGCLEA